MYALTKKITKFLLCAKLYDKKDDQGNCKQYDFKWLEQ